MHRPGTTVTRALSGLAASGLLRVHRRAPSPRRTPGSRTAVHPSPSHFTHGRVDNPWFPLRPGDRYVYRGMEGHAHSRDVLIATYRTQVDRRRHLPRRVRPGLAQRSPRGTHPRLLRTDRAGTVWYFGEHTATLDRHGHVKSREGSFLSGVDGAEAGIFMTPHPHRGPSYRQEDYPGHAEDVFTVLRRDAHVVVPLMDTRHALLTRETTALEPGVVDHKYYVRDIGTVREVTVKGGHEALKLVALTHLPRP